MCPKMMRQDVIKAFIEAHPSYHVGEHLSAGMLVHLVQLLEAETDRWFDSLIRWWSIPIENT